MISDPTDFAEKDNSLKLVFDIQKFGISLLHVQSVSKLPVHLQLSIVSML